MVDKAVGLTQVEVRIFELDKSARGYRLEISCADGSSKTGFLESKLRPDLEAEPPADPGVALFSWLVSDAELARYWAEIRGRYPRRRILLHVDPNSDLHQLPWEMMRESTVDAGHVALAENEATPFSRYWTGRSPGPITEHPIRVLAVIADPKALAGLNLYQIEREQEWAELRKSMQGMDESGIQLDLLEGPATLEAIAEKLRKGTGYHVLHFIGHGAWDNDEAWLVLADREYRVKLASDKQFGEMIRNVLGEGTSGNPLRLVYLSSCETASLDGSRGMATQLLLAGVPAVLAMQGKIGVETAREFSRIFYREVLSHGEADRACNRARAILRTFTNRGAELPVFLSRLLNGRLIAESEKQINIEDLQRFLTGQFSLEALEALGTKLGVKLDSLPADAGVKARKLIRELEAEHRLDALVAESLSASSSGAQELRRLSLSEELQELFERNAARRSESMKLARVAQAIQDGQLTEEKAQAILEPFAIVLRRIAAMAAIADGSELPGISERVLRFLGQAGDKALYPLSVVAPLIPVVLGANQVAHLNVAEVSSLKRNWEGVGQAPVWQRPDLVAAAVGLVVVVGLIVGEVVWRWPLRVWPSEPGAWTDTFEDRNLANWDCGGGAASCAPYWKPSPADKRIVGMDLPKGTVAHQVLEAGQSLYDFGFRFRFQFGEAASMMRWYVRKVGGSGYRFTLQRVGSNEGLEVRLKAEYCSGENCMPIGADKVKRHSCGIRESSDFTVNGLVEGNEFRIRAGTNLLNEGETGCKEAFEIEQVFNDGLRWRPRMLYGVLALGPSDGTIFLTQEVTILEVADGRENMGVEP